MFFKKIKIHGEANFESETSRKQSNIEVAFDARKVFSTYKK